jgi:hypothetical protein
VVGRPVLAEMRWLIRIALLGAEIALAPRSRTPRRPGKS